ncbi:nitrogenase molybdenum-iron protein alpha chain [Clostridium estertheticum]|uniref:nitrogenase molybdenum-iron protein alpha chain n=1 Tax=Clostridium estertheticum TaxID=238834 RepID=UPI001C0C1261|nr:nitrogenase molybdenum-iron protein alpha chain [Clostridium estertheticum]MBU3175953.1 nitrogenase molybdenum-iron protein alpha chain [Clostridium estertheticum]
MKEFIDKVLEKYPAKTFKNRKEHIIIKKANEVQKITANTRTIPGMITNRGCCYAGCKGVVLGPIKDMIHIVHGPIGCSYYTWGARRNKAKAEPGGQNYIEYCFSTDMQESDIIFGGEKKLRRAIKEAVEIFHPRAITISATCPVGLIGDDINAVASEAEKLYGIQVLAFNCEGYKGVSQSAGHHIANNNLMRNVIGTGTKVPTEKHSINILGEYNIGGDGWEISRVLKKIGYDIVCVMTGDGSYEQIKNAHTASLNIVQCHRSINYIAEMMEIKYGIPWIKVNFIGVTGTVQTLRDIALFFGEAELIEKTEKIIAEEIAEIEGEMHYYKSRLEGKTAFLYVGGSRSHHYQSILKDLGIETIVSGYEFAHRDDYEGREVIPDIKLDADSKNIEHLTVEKDEEKYRMILSRAKYEELAKVIPLAKYDGLIKDLDEDTVVIDDYNHYESEQLIKKLKPDMFFSGIKDKYVVQKMGVTSKQLHSYDYSGPYAGFRGAVIFAREVTSGVHTPAWRFVTPPWKVEPLLEGKVVGGDE